METDFNSRRIIEIALAFVLLMLLLSSMYTVLSPFLGVFAYVAILTVPMYKPFEKLVKLVGNRRKLAAFLYGLIAVAIVVLPFILLINTLAHQVQIMSEWLDNIKVSGPGALPESISGIPYLGPKVQEIWTQLENDPTSTLAKYEPQIKGLLDKLISGGAGIIGAGLELVVAVIISAVVLTTGAKILDPVYFLLRKIVGDNSGPAIIDATGNAIKGVTIGALGTAIICSFAAWVSFAIIGIKAAGILAAITFLLVLVQLGPALVIIGVTVWLAAQGETGWAIFMAAYGIGVLMIIDNVLKPFLIARNGHMPVLVLFLGVVGGMITWGFTGMFKGAIILAVFYTIIKSYFEVNNKSETSEAKS